jgi:anti-sigma B factor antagonist
VTIAPQTSGWIVVSQSTGTLILHLRGELDLASREIFEPAIMAAIPTAYAVVLDLSELTFCDSNGLSMFVAAHEKAAGNGTELTLRNLQPAVRRVFLVAGLDRRFKITG